MSAPTVNRARLQATLACAGTAFLWWQIGGIVAAVVAIIAGFLALVAWLSPRHYAPVQRLLDRILHIFLTGLTWFVLAVLYFGLFTPLHWWRILTKNDPLQRNFEPSGTTYLRPLPPGRPGRFDQQF